MIDYQANATNKQLYNHYNIYEYYYNPRRFLSLIKDRRKRGKPCCTSFTSIFNKCCCHWFDTEYSEFNFKFVKAFKSQEGDNWSCNGCKRGYICSDEFIKHNQRY